MRSITGTHAAASGRAGNSTIARLKTVAQSSSVRVTWRRAGGGGRGSRPGGGAGRRGGRGAGGRGRRRGRRAGRGGGRGGGRVGGRWGGGGRAGARDVAPRTRTGPTHPEPPSDR